MIIYKYNQQIEPMTDLSNEAIQNIASVYNNENLNITNLTATGNATAKNMNVGETLNVKNITVSGTATIPNLPAPKITIPNYIQKIGDIQEIKTLPTTQTSTTSTGWTAPVPCIIITYWLNSSGMCKIFAIDTDKTTKTIFASGINGLNASQVFTFLLNVGETYNVGNIKCNAGGRLFHYYRPLTISTI